MTGPFGRFSTENHRIGRTLCDHGRVIQALLVMVLVLVVAWVFASTVIRHRREQADAALTQREDPTVRLPTAPPASPPLAPPGPPMAPIPTGTPQAPTDTAPSGSPMAPTPTGRPQEPSGTAPPGPPMAPADPSQALTGAPPTPTSADSAPTPAASVVDLLRGIELPDDLVPRGDVIERPAVHDRAVFASFESPAEKVRTELHEALTSLGVDVRWDRDGWLALLVRDGRSGWLHVHPSPDGIIPPGTLKAPTVPPHTVCAEFWTDQGNPGR